MKRNKRGYGFIVTSMLLIFMLMQGCANMVTPTGGPKDTTPPKVSFANPENHCTNFSGRKIELTFDEYVTLENAKQNVLVSPPLASKPDIKLKDKTLVIKFKESLESNMTYTINFGEAIKDLHEGNLFQDYSYTFSTGETIDTLSIAGTLLSATDQKPVQDAFVSLYRADLDSLETRPTSTIPNYISKTDKDGKFHVGGLPDSKFLVFALKDVNSNLYFDLPNEEVAFIDTLVPASYPQNAFDSLAPRHFNQKSLNLNLFMFSEVDPTQMLLEKKLVEEGLLRFVFRHPAKNAVISTPETLPDTFNLVTVNSRENDTIWWYFTPNAKDSLWVQVKYDTLINDSTHYSLKFKESKKQQKKEAAKLTVKNNLIINGGLLPESSLLLKFSEPIVNITMPDSALFKTDTISTYGPLKFEKTDEHGFEFRLLTDSLLANVKYSIQIPDSTFWGIRGRTNAEIKTDFHVLKEDEYGNIFITIVPPKDLKQVVVQLTDSQGKVLKEKKIIEQKKVEFRHLAPAKYKIRALLDKDGNGKWSTGNYHRHFLPETYIDYKDELEVKAGWDIDLKEEWKL